MLGSAKNGAVRALVMGSSVRSRDADLYRRYAARLYRQALQTRGDPASAEHVVCDVIVNEAALAQIPERSEDNARYRLTERVLRRCQRLAAGAVAICPRDMAALLHAVSGPMARGDAQAGILIGRPGMRDIDVAGRCRGPAEEQEDK